MIFLLVYLYFHHFQDRFHLFCYASYFSYLFPYKFKSMNKRKELANESMRCSHQQNDSNGIALFNIDLWTIKMGVNLIAISLITLIPYIITFEGYML